MEKYLKRKMEKYFYKRAKVILKLNHDKLNFLQCCSSMHYNNKIKYTIV